MKIKKICVVITARPSYSRVKSLLQAIKRHQGLELNLIIAGSALISRYGNVVKVIENDGFTIDHKVYNVLEVENQTAMAKTTGLAIMELSNIFYNDKPDAVITIADRYETLGTSIAASFQNIPLIHIQGGEVTGSIDEKVRHANTKLADIHFVASKSAYDRVVKMGEDPNSVFVTGCPSIDIASSLLNDSDIDFDVLKKYGGVGNLSSISQGYLIVMQHPETNCYGDARNHILETLKAIDDIGHPTLWFWPNIDAGSDETSSGIRSYRENNDLENVQFFKNVEPIDFLKLLYNTDCIVGNSSVAIREAAFLGVRAVNIGDRQKNRDRGANVIDVHYDCKEIKNATIEQMNKKRHSPDFLYGKGDSGEKIAKILSSYEFKYTKVLNY